MKTKKEIKPFKMRTYKRNMQNAINILGSYFDIEDVFLNGETILILSNNNILCTRFDIIGYFDDRPEPELTYSEFMKLYGEEEEVFTRGDMERFSYYVLQSATIGTENECKRLLTNFLSERAND